MKEVHYKDKEFLITEKEFKNAMTMWDGGKNYYCERLGAVLTGKYNYIDTPINEIGKTFYLAAKEDYVTRYIKIKDKYYMFQPDDIHIEAKWVKGDFEKSLVLEEDYINVGIVKLEAPKLEKE